MDGEEGVTDTEAELLARAQQWDEQALANIYDRYSPGLYRYARRLLGEDGLAEECVADSFSRFLNAISQGKGPRKYLQAYLYRIAHNWVTDFYRREPNTPVLLDPHLHADPSPGPMEQVTQIAVDQEVRTALKELTPDQRQVIVLKYLEEWNNAQIAEALEKPVGAVKALQHRGLNALRRLLVREEQEAKSRS